MHLARGRGGARPSLGRTACLTVRHPVADRVPRLPSDAEDDRRDDKGDARVSDVAASRADLRAENYHTGDVGVGTGVVSVGDEGGTVESPARPRSDG